MYREFSMQNSSGFTLVEVMVAMAILLIGLLGLVGQWPMGTDLVMLSGYRSEASVLAERFLEEVAALDFPSAASLGSGSRYVDGYTISYVISPGPVEGTLAAEVHVSWDHKGRTHSLNMSTVVGSLL